MTNREKMWIADTNFVYDHLESVIDDRKLVLMSTVRFELDKHKTAEDKNLQYKARKANRFIFENYDKFHHDVGEYLPEDILGQDYSNDVMDYRILACAVKNGYSLLTGDLNLYSTAKSFGVEVENFNEESSYKQEDYKGYKEVYMLPDEHQDFYTNKLAENVYDLNVNQYLIVIDDISGEPIDALKWDGKCHHKVKNRTIRSLKMGTMKPKDLYQACAIDSLNTNQITLINGKAGSGKTLLALSFLMQQIEKGKLSKLVVFANSLPTKGAAQLGLYKGSLQDKILQVSVGHILASKFGDYNEVQAMMTTGELLVLPMSDLRGFDPTGMNAGILITEGQNMDVSLMKLAAERVSEDSLFVVEGDFSQQLDDKSFEGSNNGMRRLSEVFRGEKYFGQVETKNVYRSKIADKAQEM